MKPQKQVIELKNIPALLAQLKAAVAAGNEVVEKIRCAFTLTEDPCIYLYTVFDLLDANIPISHFTRFLIYRLFDEKSNS